MCIITPRSPLDEGHRNVYINSQITIFSVTFFCNLTVQDLIKCAYLFIYFKYILISCMCDTPQARLHANIYTAFFPQYTYIYYK